MPRIGGGGGGPIVPPQAQGAQQAQQAPKTDFAAKVAQQTAAQGTDAARTQATKAQTQSELTGKVKDIAKRFSSGKLNQKEATREFVSLVIEERFPQFKKKKKKKGQGGSDAEDEEETNEPEDASERLEEAVTELIDRDPGLAKKLSSQFKKLAKG
ncbi:MAG: hypothetical protein U1E65_07435 [Myxococcota bacterium]